MAIALGLFTLTGWTVMGRSHTYSDANTVVWGRLELPVPTWMMSSLSAVSVCMCVYMCVYMHVHVHVVLSGIPGGE